MLDDLLATVRQHMEVEDAWHKDMRFHIIGRIFQPQEQNIKLLKEKIEQQRLLALFAHKTGRDHVEILPFYPRPERPNWWLSGGLFVATILSTLFVGAYHRLGRMPISLFDFLAGAAFSFSIMAILTSHELGHYFTARKYGVRSSLPYFLPIPHPLLGTLGAIMRIKSLLPSRRSLLAIGMAGPMCGFVVAVPLTVVGLFLSQVHRVGAGTAGLRLGEPLLFHLLGKLAHPGVPSGYDIFLHPMAYAGWLGLLVTAMNLMPIGQLDGGHVAFAVLGRRRWALIPVMVVVLILLAGKGFYQWVIWLVLATLLSMREPVIQDRITRLSWKEIALVLIPLGIFILAFTPVPFSFF